MERFQGITVLAALMLAVASCGSSGPRVEPDPQPMQPAWPMAGGNPQRNGQSTLPGPVLGNEFTLLEDYWVYEAPQSEYRPQMSAHVIDGNGNIYFTTDDAVYSLTPNGGLRWSRRDFSPEIPLGVSFDYNSNPVFTSDGSILFRTDHNELIAVNTDGDLQWVWDTNAYNLQLLTGHNRIFIHESAYLKALDNAGNLVWKVGLPGGSNWDISPAMSPTGDVLAASNDGRYWLVSSAGEIVWFYLPDDPVGELRSMLVYADGLWIVPDESGWIALDSAGFKVWSHPDSGSGNAYRTPAAMDLTGNILLLSSQGGNEHRQLSALYSNGLENWTVEVNSAGLLHSNNMLVDSRGYIHLISGSGIEIWDSGGNRVGAFQYGIDHGLNEITSLAIGPDGRLSISAESAGLIGMR